LFSERRISNTNMGNAAVSNSSKKKIDATISMHKK
jgi:hypothetical protein